MANPTSNFGWQMPTPTDLVTDLPADFEVFGQAVDSSLADLKGGTTGQVLAKNSGTDMDFIWVAQDDSNAIQNAIVDAKGDLIAASANDTPARLAVGANGETLVADSSTSTGLRYTGNYAAGKNQIINGAFDNWQRGTTATVTGTASPTLLADRFFCFLNGDGTGTQSQQTFTAGAAPVAGYEGQYFHRLAIGTLGTTTTAQVGQKIEDVRTFAGNTVTFSFYAKADSARSFAFFATQNFGSGGSSSVTTNGSSFAVTTSWTRFTGTINIPSVSGKTIGAGSNLNIFVQPTVTAGFSLDTWGWQLEDGSVATAFQTASGSIAGELALAQRYYYRAIFDQATSRLGVGYNLNTTSSQFTVPFPVTMRTRPTALEQSGTAGDYSVAHASTNTVCSAVPAFGSGHISQGVVTLTVASGLTTGDGMALRNVNTDAYLGWSAEL
jgi:hypothetical protein